MVHRRQLQLKTFLRWHVQLAKPTHGNISSIAAELPTCRELLQIHKVELVVHADRWILCIEQLCFDGLVDLPHFEQMWIWPSITLNQTVDTEVPIIRSITKISTVGDVLLAFLARNLSKQSLIYPIPDEATLELRMPFHRVPIILQVTDAISHGMRVLTQDEWPPLFAARVPPQMRDVRIHGTIDVGVLCQLGSLVLNWARRISLFDPIVVCPEINSISRLVA
jgi:hypothetical protein